MGGVSCAKNHDIKRRRAVVKLPCAREKEREEDTVCSIVHNIFSRDVISEIHTGETQVSYVTLLSHYGDISALPSEWLKGVLLWNTLLGDP